MRKCLNNFRLDFGQSIVGFEQYRYFQINGFEEESKFCILQSEGDSNIGFVLVSPFEQYPEYEVQLSEEIIETLRITSPEDVAVFNIVTIRHPFESSTINLFAPLVVNVQTGESRQILLSHTAYSIHSPIFPQRSEVG
ncbi:hypothetical protein PCCS19_13170 [Paenibacillus sp. CCS19]|uniref:flagellar assembly protein FliW n=1 Tax=Paenibacillus sp. CCS19 TaxID=3158387 RepID=UPI0025612D83|nr:flagellar assembly protein FliW [Paenibacillus cellulosilyticus]GMK38263.1 hypothetical protein PCCS19_13170 [Paenibacillus cellulosilyticus]